MSREKRIRLVELSRQYQVPIIEDDAYGFLHYESQQIPPLRSLDDRFVFYIGTFSKILAPALRAGWIVAPQELMSRISIVKEASDIDTATFAQRIVSSYCDNETISVRIAMLCREYKSRRDAMLRALKDNLAGMASWRKPTNGFFVWVELSGRVDGTEFLKEAVRAEQVAFIPGAAFSISGGPRAANCIRLNFSNPSEDVIADAVKRLGLVLERLQVK